MFLLHMPIHHLNVVSPRTFYLQQAQLPLPQLLHKVLLRHLPV